MPEERGKGQRVDVRAMLQNPRRLRDRLVKSLVLEPPQARQLAQPRRPRALR